MMRHTLSLTTTPSLRSLCPVCGSRHLYIHTPSVTSTEVVFDEMLNDLMVVHEQSDPQGWDEQDEVTCPSCKWQGRVSGIVLDTPLAT